MPVEKQSGSFPKHKKLLKNAEFKKIMQNGARVTLSDLSLFWMRSASEKPARVGISVSRKIGNAVERNRIKRRMRELLRTYPQQLPKGLEFVVLPKPSCLKAKWTDLQGELYRTLNELVK